MLSEPATFAVAAAVVIFTVASAVTAVAVAVVVTANTSSLTLSSTLPTSKLDGVDKVTVAAAKAAGVTVAIPLTAMATAAGGGATPSFLCPHGHHRYSCSYSPPPALMKWIEQDYIL